MFGEFSSRCDKSIKPEHARIATACFLSRIMMDTPMLWRLSLPDMSVSMVPIMLTKVGESMVFQIINRLRHNQSIEGFLDDALQNVKSAGTVDPIVDEVVSELRKVWDNNDVTHVYKLMRTLSNYNLNLPGWYVDMLFSITWPWTCWPKACDDMIEDFGVQLTYIVNPNQEELVRAIDVVVGDCPFLAEMIMEVKKVFLDVTVLSPLWWPFWYSVVVMHEKLATPQAHERETAS